MVIMIEAGANVVPEDKMLEAIFKAHEINRTIIDFIDKIVAECGKAKHSYESHVVPADLWEDMLQAIPAETMENAVFTDEKQKRDNNIFAMKQALSERFKEIEILHVSGADLKEIHFFEDRDLFRAHDLGTNGQACLLLCFKKESDAFFVKSLEIVR